MCLKNSICRRIDLNQKTSWTIFFLIFEMWTRSLDLKTVIGIFTDILAGFTFNNRVLRLPAIVLLNTCSIKRLLEDEELCCWVIGIWTFGSFSIYGSKHFMFRNLRGFFFFLKKIIEQFFFLEKAVKKKNRKETEYQKSLILFYTVFISRFSWDWIIRRDQKVIFVKYANFGMHSSDKKVHNYPVPLENRRHHTKFATELTELTHCQYSIEIFFFKQSRFFTCVHTHPPTQKREKKLSFTH